MENVRGEDPSSKNQSSEVVKHKHDKRGQVLRMASECSTGAKKNGKIRMCIDFIDLNKACKKDPFRLPRIDTSIDKAAGCKHFSLLNCFSGYH